MLEVHKPSSQITCLYEKSGKTITLQPFQHDVMNFFCYKMREHIMISNSTNEMLKTFKSDDDLFDFLRMQKVTIKLSEITDFTKKYIDVENRKNMIDNIKQLQQIIVNVGQFKSDHLMAETSFPLITRLRRITNSNEITIWLEPELTLGWIFQAKPFAKLHLKIQTTLSKTYTKILYEICKDYLNLGCVTKDIELWKQVLHIKGENLSRLKANYLNASIKEINEKTDIKITNLFSKKKNGKTSLTLEFEKQAESRLQELGLLEQTIDSLPFYNKSKAKLNVLVKGGYNVVDEEMWIQTDIKKNEEKYDAETRLDIWLKETPDDIKNNIYKILANEIDECDDISIYINEYRITGLFSQESFTKNALETIEKLNNVIDAIQE